MIAIVDYGAGNLHSVQRALAHAGASTREAVLRAAGRAVDELLAAL